MGITLENKQALIAGDGILPIRMAQYAKDNGFEVVCISLAKDNVKELKKYCSKVYSCHPGEVNKMEKILKDEEIKQLTFLGKVHKKVLLQLHKFDKRAVDLVKEAARLNDDKVMLIIVNELKKIGIEGLTFRLDSLRFQQRSNIRQHKIVLIIGLAFQNICQIHQLQLLVGSFSHKLPPY